MVCSAETCVEVELGNAGVSPCPSFVAGATASMVELVPTRKNATTVPVGGSGSDT
jgi:hypothetical protein